jgi:hypothetical protein
VAELEFGKRCPLLSSLPLLRLCSNPKLAPSLIPAKYTLADAVAKVYFFFMLATQDYFRAMLLLHGEQRSLATRRLPGSDNIKAFSCPWWLTSMAAYSEVICAIDGLGKSAIHWLQ